MEKKTVVFLTVALVSLLAFSETYTRWFGRGRGRNCANQSEFCDGSGRGKCGQGRGQGRRRMLKRDGSGKTDGTGRFQDGQGPCVDGRRLGPSDDCPIK